MIRLLVLFLAVIGPSALASDATSAFVYDQRLGNQVPLAARFRDQHDMTVTLGQVLGHRPAILVLGAYHCRNLCPEVRNDLMKALSRLEDFTRYSLVMLSIDPAETPSDARSALAEDAALADQPGDPANWHYLTGSIQPIGGVAEAVGFRWRFDSAHQQFLHPAGLVFLTGDGSVSSYLLGQDYRPGDVLLALTRAAGDRVDDNIPAAAAAALQP
jgi:protein SCO1/2